MIPIQETYNRHYLDECRFNDMNTKNNQRAKETEELIFQTFEVLLEEGNTNITVQMLCKRAGIHRTTFYGHYEDINALKTEIVRNLYLSSFKNFFDENGDFNTKGFLDYCKDIQNRKSFYSYFFHVLQSEMHLNEKVPEMFLQNSEELKRIWHLSTERELLYQYSFFAAGSNGLINSWLANDCKEPPETIANLMKTNFNIFFHN